MIVQWPQSLTSGCWEEFCGWLVAMAAQPCEMDYVWWTELDGLKLVV